MRGKVNFRYEFKGMVTKEPIMVEAVIDDKYADHVNRRPIGPEFELISLKFSEIKGEEVDCDNSLCIIDMASAILEIMKMIDSHLATGQCVPV